MTWWKGGVVCGLGYPWSSSFTVTIISVGCEGKVVCYDDSCNSRALQANKFIHAISLVVLLLEQEDYGCMATAVKHTETLNAMTSGFLFQDRKSVV